MRFGDPQPFAIDGALGSVIKTYLVVQQTDSAAQWLEPIWPNVKQQMEIVFTKFDVGNGKNHILFCALYVYMFAHVIYD